MTRARYLKRVRDNHSDFTSLFSSKVGCKSVAQDDANRTDIPLGSQKNPAVKLESRSRTAVWLLPGIFGRKVKDGPPEGPS